MSTKERILANLLDITVRVQNGVLDKAGWEREIENLDKEIQDISSLLDLIDERGSR